MDGDGNIVTQKQEIDNILINHFSKLWSKEDSINFKYILNALPNDLHTLNPAQCDFLTTNITEDKIHNILFSLSQGKSLGPDGLNVEFYKFIWEDLGDHLFFCC